MTLTVTQLYQLLSEKMDKETAEALTTYISERVKNDIQAKTENLVTKQDLANTKVDMIKWFFGMFITLALMIIGLYLKIGEIL